MYLRANSHNCQQSQQGRRIQTKKPLAKVVQTQIKVFLAQELSAQQLLTQKAAAPTLYKMWCTSQKMEIQHISLVHPLKCLPRTGAMGHQLVHQLLQQQQQAFQILEVCKCLPVNPCHQHLHASIATFISCSLHLVLNYHNIPK